MKKGDLIRLKRDYFGLHKNEIYQVLGEGNSINIIGLKKIYGDDFKSSIGANTFGLPRGLNLEYYEIL